MSDDSLARLEAELRALRSSDRPLEPRAAPTSGFESASRSDTVSRLEAELESLRETSARRTESRSDSVTRLEAELAALRAPRVSREDTVEKLRSELSALKKESVSRSESKKADTVSRLEAELAALRSTSARRDESRAREDTVEKLRAELSVLKKESVPRDPKADTVSRLEAELAALREASLTKSRKSDTAARLEAEIEDLRTKTASRSKVDTVSRLEEELAALRAPSSKVDTVARLEAEVAALRSSSVSGSVADSSLDSETIRALKAEKERLKRELAGSGDLDSLRRTLASKKAEVLNRQFGIDVCFLVDCTGSMSCWIDAVRQKVREIVTQTEHFAQNACVRVSFCGYRDLGDQERFAIQDFVEKTDLASFEHLVQTTQAKGGDDGPEDIVGGMKQALRLSWSSSTRVIIHIADAPCHGRTYHSMHDDYPGGDPSGLTPENILEQIKKKRIHYYFVEINQSTQKMCQILSQVYAGSDYQFQVKPLGSNPESLLPAVLDSIRLSVSVTMRVEATRF